MNCRWLRSAPVADPPTLLQLLVLLLLVAARAQALKRSNLGHVVSFDAQALARECLKEGGRELGVQ